MVHRMLFFFFPLSKRDIEVLLTFGSKNEWECNPFLLFARRRRRRNGALEYLWAGRM